MSCGCCDDPSGDCADALREYPCTPRVYGTRTSVDTVDGEAIEEILASYEAALNAQARLLRTIFNDSCRLKNAIIKCNNLDTSDVGINCLDCDG